MDYEIQDKQWLDDLLSANKILGIVLTLATGRTVFPKPLRDSASRYSYLLDQQNKILDNNCDLETLVIGMKRMPKLKHISVLDKFDGDIDRQGPCLWKRHKFKRYSQW